MLENGLDAWLVRRLAAVLAVSLGVAVAVLSPSGLTAQEIRQTQVLFDRQVMPEAVAVAPGDVHAYVVSMERDGIAVLERDGTGVFEAVQYVFDDRDGVDGLKDAFSVAVSPDGGHVYVGGVLTDSGSSEGIAIFERHAVTGMLTFVEVDTTVTSIRELVFFGDEQLYVSARDSLAVFGRNVSTGELTLVDLEVDGEAGVDGLATADGIAVPPDGQHVYVTGSFDDAVAVFSRAGDGSVTFVDALFDGVDADNIDGAQSVVSSSDGLYIYVASVFDNSLTAFSRDVGSGLLTVIDEEIDGVGGVNFMAQPSKVLIPSDEADLFTVSASDSSIVGFDRDPVTGLLTIVSVTLDDGSNGGLVGVRDIAATGDGAQLLTAGYTESEVGAFDRSPGGWPLWDHTVTLHDGDIKGLDTPSSLALSHDLSSLYVAGVVGTLAHFDRNPASGQLAFVEALFDGKDGVDGLASPQDVVISVDDSSVYSASVFDSAVSLFSRDPATGSLTYVESVVDGEGGVSGIENVFSIALSADSSRLYAAGRNAGGSVALFNRDPATGELDYVDSWENGTGGIEDLILPTWLGLTSDGTSLYVGASSAVVAFSVDPATGELAFVDSYSEFFVNVVGISPDGHNVYAVLDFPSDKINVYERDAASGELTLIQVVFGSGIPGLANGDAESLTVRGDGERLYVGAIQGLIVFARDTATGEIGYLETVEDGPDGLEAADHLGHLSMTPDGLYLYGLSRGDDAISTLTAALLFGDGFESGDTSAWSTTVP